MEKVLLTVGVGSTDLRAFERSVGAVVRKIRENFPEYRHCFAVLSEKTAALLQGSCCVKVNALTETLAAFSAEQLSELLILPILLTAGREYRQILAAAEAFPDLPLRILRPLLSGEDDLPAIAKVLKEKASSFDEDTLTVFVAHGTAHSKLFLKLQQLLFREESSRILIGTISGGPTFYEVLRYARTSPYQKIALLPLLLSSGRHAERDLFGEENSWKAGFLAAGFSVEVFREGIAEYRSVQRLFCQKVEENE